VLDLERSFLNMCTKMIQYLKWSNDEMVLQENIDL